MTTKYARKVQTVGNVSVELANHLDALHDLTNEFADRLRHRMVPKNAVQTVQGHTAYLRSELGLWKHIVAIRQSFTTVATVVAQQATMLENSVRPASTNLKVGTYGSGWNQGRRRPETRKSAEMVSNLPSFQQFADCASANRELEGLAERIDTLFRDFERQPNKEGTMVHRRLPEWVDAKPTCPVGGRDAWSVLRVLTDHGTPHDNKLGHDMYLGLADWNYDTLSSNLSAIVRQIRPVRQRTGPAPSVRSGRKLTKQYRYTIPTATDRSKSIRIGTVHSTIHDMLAGKAVGYSSPASPTLALVAKQRGDSIGVKMLCRIIGIDQGALGNISGPTTVVTGRPESLGEHANEYGTHRDYRVAAVWRTNGSIVEGWLLMRQGWQDTYHLSWSEANSPVQPGCRYATQYPDQIGQLPNPHLVLDRATEWHFSRLVQEKQTEEIRKRRIATILRKLRQLPEVRREASYAVGNCAPGTDTFLRQLGLTGSYCHGRELAVAWRKAGYVSIDRFEPVVYQVHKSRLAQLDAVWCGLVAGEQTTVQGSN